MLINRKISVGLENLNPLSANPTKWPNTLKQFVGKLPTNCLSLFGHFCEIGAKGLSSPLKKIRTSFQGCVRFFLLVCFVSLKENTCETTENVFYFTSKALFVLEIIEF